MATIDTNIDTNHQLTIHTIVGEVLAEEISDKIRTYSESGPTNYVLWDFSRAVLDKIKSHDVEIFISLTSQYASYRKGGKTALVFSSDLGFGLGREFDTYTDLKESRIPYMTFRRKEDAIKWLLE
ncbi:MAG: hypothetical protein EHM64_13780 [Ignavibacteriae bacterium]|nr:MAG: hypothetical protein EHM64_13780 [Ignavibacteriota bacterium]